MGAAEDVARGVRLLDRVAQPNWRARIKIGMLDLGCKELCILAQLYGSYDKATPIWREITKLEAGKYGFCVNTNDLKIIGLAELDVIVTRYQELKKAWIAVLQDT